MVVAFASVVEASTAAPMVSVEAAEVNLQASIGVRSGAERRVASLEQTQASIRVQIDAASGETAAVTSQLAEARQEARVRAVDAYVNGGIATQLMAFIRSDEIDDAAARTAVLSSQAHSAVEAADEFQKLKEENDPKTVALAERLHSVSRELTDARSDLLQAEAQQADAELVVVAARAQAQNEEAAKAAAAQKSTKAPTGTRPAPRPAAAKPTGAAPAVLLTGMDAAWAALRECESGGNYQIVSSSGRYRGAYQFSQSTWDSVAASVLPEYVGVDPAQAPPSVQDTMARKLYEQRGSRPWPHCGRHLR
jgi:hypothetical protein